MLLQYCGYMDCFHWFVRAEKDCAYSYHSTTMLFLLAENKNMCTVPRGGADREASKGKRDLNTVLLYRRKSPTLQWIFISYASEITGKIQRRERLEKLQKREIGSGKHCHWQIHHLLKTSLSPVMPLPFHPSLPLQLVCLLQQLADDLLPFCIAALPKWLLD